MKERSPAKRRIEVYVGESVRILRELKKLSENELAGMCGIPQSTIPAIETDRISLGVERARTLARALKCHPAVLLFPNQDVEVESAALRPPKSAPVERAFLRIGVVSFFCHGSEAHKETP